VGGRSGARPRLPRGLPRAEQGQEPKITPHSVSLVGPQPLRVVGNCRQLPDMTLLQPTTPGTATPTTGPTSVSSPSPSQSRTSPPASPEPPKPKPSAGRRIWLGVKWVLDFLIAQWFLCGIGIVIGLAYKFPNVAKTK
jgi:hypothetical protein